ncbi:MAG: thioredoxin family protein [Prevotella sp.]|nr:thioredoxin family protein [Prevotella sp.]
MTKLSLKSYLRSFFLLLLFILPIGSRAQVKFTASMQQTAPDEITISFSGTINKGWHVYAPEEKHGPTAASINIDKIEGARLEGGLKANKPATKKYEEVWKGEVAFFEDNVVFTQKVKLTGKEYKIEGYFEYGACNDDVCIPPTSVDFNYSGTVSVPAVKAEKKNDKIDEETAPSPVKGQGDSLSSSKDTTTQKSQDSTQTTSVTTPFPRAGNVEEVDGLKGKVKGTGLGALFLLGFLGGLIALLTPCVWPIIPMTVSFFLKRASKDESGKGKVVRSAKGIRDAIIYGISIIVIYLALGLAVTAIFGASALNAMSTNAIFNIFFFLMLLAFGISFLGGFEITLPSSWNNAVDKKASSTSGLLSIFLMAFTLALVSFSCTGPIIGFLLVEMGTSGNIIGPAVGMFGFALALALPFTLFAIFPSWLKSAPKSGNWMNCIKVTLGFIEIAFSLKFLSVADLAYGWHILDREVFLSLWIILFFLLGCYLIGWIRFPHDEDEFDEMGEKIINPRTSVTRFFVALCSFAFALYMVPGLWGAPCKAVSAFAPPMSTQDFNLYKSETVEAKYKDYELGMQAAKAEGKPVMIDFTGYGCVNCRKMEAAVWTDERVKDLITNDYVLIQLFVDDKTPLAEPIEVVENGQPRKLRTIGDKWSYLQRTKFGSNTQPFYVLLDNEEKPLATPRSYDEDIEAYISFLKEGIRNY